MGYDIDVIMPVDDYDRLEKYYRNDFAENYFLQSYESEPECRLTFKKLRKSDTTLIDNMKDKNVNHGINIDIYPYYHLSNNKIRQNFQYLDQMFWMLFTVGGVPKNHGKILATFSDILLKILPDTVQKKIRMRAYKGMNKYNDIPTENVFFGHYFGAIGQKFKSKWFEKAEYVKFEDGNFPIPIGADEMLTERYGDYMKLPPEEDRVAKMEDIIFWSADIPYAEYEKMM